MSNLWEGLFAALVLAGISAVTFIAYKHPTGYNRLYWPLFATVMITWLLWMAYGFGHHSGFSDALIQINSLNPELHFRHPPPAPEPLWMYFAPVVIVVYLLSLLWLPLLLADDP